MKRIALIGCGRHARACHAPSLARYASDHSGEIELAAACDLDLEKAGAFCQRFGFLKAYSDLGEMLRAEKIDGIVSVMPHGAICEMGIRLFKIGIPCVIEKPLGASIEDVRRLARAAEETGAPHIVSVNRRFSPYLNRAIEFAAERGPIRFLRVSMVRWRRAEDTFVWETAIHAVDAARHVAGEIESYEARAIRHPEMGGAWFLIDAQFKSGCKGRIEILPTTGMREETYDLYGENYRALASVMEAPRAYVKCWSSNKFSFGRTASPNAPAFQVDGSYEETAAFIRMLDNPSTLAPTVPAIAPAAEICWAIALRQRQA